MRKGLINIVLIVFILTSCEEYYKPAINVVPSLFVVDAHLSNDPKSNYVKLSMTSDFYSLAASDWVTGANVKLIEDGNHIIAGYEQITGNYTFVELPVSGKTYQIRITYKGDIYESNTVIMPPLPRIDSLYTKDKLVNGYLTDSYGAVSPIETPSRDICIDAPITSTLEYYRFSNRAVLQWVYVPQSSSGPPPPPWFGWKSVHDNGLFNLAGPKNFSVSADVHQHSLMTLAYNVQNYLDSASQTAMGWILIIDQYGITKESYDFHRKLNQQFSAEGVLFDPVQTQIYGNIHCVTSPDKIVLGFFDLNSYRQYRYYLYLGTGPDNKGVQRRLNRYPDIPEEGYHEDGTRPDFWETN